jgi:hypothetical protein
MNGVSVDGVDAKNNRNAEAGFGCQSLDSPRIVSENVQERPRTFSGPLVGLVGRYDTVTYLNHLGDFFIGRHGLHEEGYPIFHGKGAVEPGFVGHDWYESPCSILSSSIA